MGYPHCESLGVLRNTVGSSRVVSTSALYEKLGPKLYHECRAYFEYPTNRGPSPASVEKFLTERNLPCQE